MNEGWKCPECGRCYAPWVKSCDAVDCGAKQQPGVTIAPPPIWQEPNTIPWTPNTWYGTISNGTVSCNVAGCSICQ